MIYRNWFFLVLVYLSIAISFFAIFTEWESKYLVMSIALGICVISISRLVKKSLLNKQYLSSPFSLIYYSVIPVVLIGLFTSFMAVIYSGILPFYYVEEGVVFVPLLLAFLFLAWKLKTVCYDSNELIFFGWGDEIRTDIKNIKEIRRFLFYFYRLHMTSGSLIWLFPPISEVFTAFWGTPKAVKKFREKLLDYNDHS